MGGPADAPTMPPIDELDGLDAAAFVAAVGPLFEHAPAFLHHLAAARPFGSEDALFTIATGIALGLEDADAEELLDAHPRLGAPPGSVSALRINVGNSPPA